MLVHGRRVGRRRQSTGCVVPFAPPAHASTVEQRFKRRDAAGGDGPVSPLQARPVPLVPPGRPHDGLALVIKGVSDEECLEELRRGVTRLVDAGCKKGIIGANACDGSVGSMGHGTGGPQDVDTAAPQARPERGEKRDSGSLYISQEGG